MRVLAVIPGDGKGSSFIFSTRQVQALVKLGVAANIFHLKSRTSLSVVVKEWSRLRRAIKEYSPDVVHAHYGTVTAFLCVLATSRPVAITFRGSDLNRDPSIGTLQTFLGHFLSQISALRARLVFCASSQLRSRLWWRRQKAMIFPTGVNVEIFHPMSKERARERLGWKTDERVVLFNAGRNPIVKGLSLAEEAVAIARWSVDSIQFVQLKGEAPPEDIPLFLNAADCLLITSTSEGSSTILQEAMACNLPVVSVNVGDAAERLDGVHPSRVVPRDSMALGQAIIEILTQCRRSNGREEIMECSEEHIAQKIKDAYSAAGEKARPSNCKSAM